MKFRLTTIAYVFALLAAGMAVAGVGSLLITSVLISYWHFTLRSDERRRWNSLILVPTLLALTAAWFTRTAASGYYALQRQLCLSNIKQLGHALHSYESIHRTLPPAATLDENGNKLHSWRTLVLDHLNEKALQASLDLKKPWDDPRNFTKLRRVRPSVFACPLHDDPAATSYFAVTGEQTAWPPGRGRRWEEIPDGASNTLLLLEIPHKHTTWAEPSDVTFSEALTFLTTPPSEPWAGHRIDQGFFFRPSYGVLIKYVDGRSSYLELPISREAATAILTVNGGERISEDQVSRPAAARLDYPRCYAFAVFVTLAASPGVWLALNRTDALTSPAAR